jgi:hypothetical protein
VWEEVETEVYPPSIPNRHMTVNLISPSQLRQLPIAPSSLLLSMRVSVQEGACILFHTLVPVSKPVRAHPYVPRAPRACVPLPLNVVLARVSVSVFLSECVCVFECVCVIRLYESTRRVCVREP